MLFQFVALSLGTCRCRDTFSSWGCWPSPVTTFPFPARSQRILETQNGLTDAQDEYNRVTDDQVLASAKIGRAWRKRMLRKGPLLQRKNFLERLSSEFPSPKP
jgi:hypothetical protein